jgi:hypothetical protein
MTGGVRAEVAVHGPSNCPVAAFSRESGAPVTDVTWTRAETSFTEEFRIDAARATDGEGSLGDADAVLDVGDERVYQFTREADQGCACEAVEALGVPIADVVVEGEALVLTLHLEGVERLREVVASLRGVGDRVEVRYLVHADADADEGDDRTVVDRGRLTDRQREVLTTAYRMGYFEYPREANASEVADALDISLATFTEHLAAAQGKLLEDVLGES